MYKAIMYTETTKEGKSITHYNLLLSIAISEHNL